MSTTITKGATVITPDLVLAYETETDSQNVIHKIIGQAAPYVTLRDDTLRKGRLELYCNTRTKALAAFNAHKTSGSFVLASAEESAMNMTYVRDGSLTLAMVKVDDEPVSKWLVTVGYQEIA